MASIVKSPTASSPALSAGPAGDMGAVGDIGERQPGDGWRELTQAQKAAAVLLVVGPETANAILELMPEGDVERVALEIATLGEIAPTQMQAVLEEFYTEALVHQQLVSGGERHAREMLRRWRGDEADDIVDRLLATVRTTPFNFLRFHEASEIVEQLREEHPQTVALVLAHLPTRLGAQILGGLEPHQQGEVALRVATMSGAATEVVARVEDALEARIGGRFQRGGSRDDKDGTRELANMLNNSDRGTERAILGSLEATDPELAEEVRALMFVFEDIVTLDDRSVQEVLRQVEPVRLALALKAVADEVRDTIMRNLSDRAREALVEEIDLLGPTRVRDVEAAQSEVVRTIRQMEEAGQIVIQRGEDGEMV
jgi:flagellar motor switch protein FliG